MLWMITDFKKYASSEAAFNHIKKIVAAGVRKVMLRSSDSHFSEREYFDLASTVINAFPDVRFFIPENIAFVEMMANSGLHLTSRSIPMLSDLKEKYPETVFSVSVHSEAEAIRVFEDGADYALYSPV